MVFYEIDWADSELESLYVTYDTARLLLWNDSLQKRLQIRCTGFAGMTSMCIWDDMILSGIRCRSVTSENCEYIRQLHSIYDSSVEYGGRWINCGFYELEISLANATSFCLYAQTIQVMDVEQAY